MSGCFMANRRCKEEICAKLVKEILVTVTSTHSEISWLEDLYAIITLCDSFALHVHLSTIPPCQRQAAICRKRIKRNKHDPGYFGYEKKKPMPMMKRKKKNALLCARVHQHGQFF